MATSSRPGIKPKLGTINLKPDLSALEAAFDDMAKRSVQKRRKGLCLLVRRLCYFVLNRT